MTDIIQYIIDNPEVVTDWVHEFFDGKYTREEVVDYLYGIEEDGMPRRGVVQLSKEFNSLADKNTESIRKWYSDTDFYVFDLLPWNASNMFKAKADAIINLINTNGYQSVTDFGGGLGIMSIYIRANTKCKVTYVDLKDGVTFKFAKFLLNKLNVDGVDVLGDEEYFSSSLKTDCILATDCFEHIPNMGETFEKLTAHANTIYHDSTFHADKWSPQHVFTPTQIEFLNLCANYNYLPDPNNVRLLYRMRLQFTPAGEIFLTKV